ncbi:potassium channel family protein [Halorussus sp. AFM4]|uniref:potassium channel family protein n=1 Tax=Halorussus sp. AFM4 TaxID=3421651 RepID=UPI003EB938DF
MYIIIVGAGDIGAQLLDLVTREPNDVVVVESDEATANEVAQRHDCLVLNADATSMETLEEAGADRADAIVSTTDDDATNVMVMLLAREFGVPSQVSVVQNPEHMRLFRELEVTVLENPEHLIAEYLFRAVQRPSVEDFMHLAGGAEVFEITVGGDGPIAGRTLRDADEADVLPDDVRVVAIERDESALLPRGDTEVREGDLVTVFSKRGFAPEILGAFTGANREATRA